MNNRLKLFIAALITLMLSLMGTAALAAEPNGITVTGEAVAEIEADMATISGTLEAKAPTAEEARARVASQLAAVKHVALGQALVPQNIANTNYAIYPVYVRDGNKQKQDGFRATSNITIRVEDLAKLSKVLDGSITNAGLRINNVAFALKNKNIIERSLLKEAVLNAREKAAIVATAGGRSLGVLVSANVQNRTGEARIAYNAPRAAMTKDSLEANPTVLAPRTIEVHTSVNVVFSLRND